MRSAPRHENSHCHPPGLSQSGNRRTVYSGGQSCRGLKIGLCDVVVHHQVVLRHQHRLEPGAQRGKSFRFNILVAPDEDRLGCADGFPEDLEPGSAKRGPGVDDIGHHVGHSQPDGRFHGAVEPYEIGLDALFFQPASQKPGVRGRDALARQVCNVIGPVGWRRESEPTATKPKRQDLRGAGPRVEEHVPASDPDIQVSFPHVHGDVAGAQVVELDIVSGVHQGQVLGVGALPVSGGPEHGGGPFSQGAFVGYGDLQHFHSPGSQVPVHIFEVQVQRDHHHLEVVQQLADLQRGVFGCLVFSGHPHLGRLLHHFLADVVHPCVQASDCRRSLRSGPGGFSELFEELFKGLHEPTP